MDVQVLLASAIGFRAIGPVLAEVDEARRILAPSGTRLRATLLAAVDATKGTGCCELATQLGLDLDHVEPSTDGPIGPVLDGFAAALQAGCDVLVTIDADGQHDARQIPDLVRSHLARGSGLTIGSRWIRGGSSPGTSVLRSGISRGGNTVAKAFTGAKGVSDSTTSFRVYSPEVAQLLLQEDLPHDTWGFLSASVAIAQAHGFAVDEVPIVFRPRYSGAGELRLADLAEFGRQLPPVRRRVREVRRRMRHDQSLWARRNPRLREQMESGESVFAATEELGNLADADRFLDWITDELEPHLGPKVLEVGAGFGAIAARVAARGHHVTAIEPATNVFPELASRVAGVAHVEALDVTSQELLATGSAGRFDSVIYVSVLEHILDDCAELRTARELLRPGGTLGIFVPAMPALYGSLDFKSGHYRRYDRPMLRTVITDAGFELEDVHHLDLAGVVPYYLMYRLLNVQRLDSGSSAIYDSVVVPVSRLIQRVGPPPLRQEPRCGCTSTAGSVPTRFPTMTFSSSRTGVNGPPTANIAS